MGGGRERETERDREKGGGKIWSRCERVGGVVGGGLQGVNINQRERGGRWGAAGPRQWCGVWWALVGLLGDARGGSLYGH